jgi:hypothetical protein
MKKTHPLVKGLQGTMIDEVPAYANKFFYSLGFLSMICFLVLIATGITMVFFGPDWWLTNAVGKYVRSIHLWATQAFVLFIILHMTIVFLTSGFKKPRSMTWVLGVIMFLFVMTETEFGYVLRGDYSSQWRSLQGADFYNGLGKWINSLNYKQIYGIHIVVVPAIILGALFLHYLLVRILGIAKPYRKEVRVPTVKANHTKLFVRGGILIGVILVLAHALPSPFIKPDTIRDIAENDPRLVGQTLMSEYDHSSDTATYLDNIDPYKFDTRTVFIEQPYAQITILTHTPNLLGLYDHEPQALQDAQLAAAKNYFDKGYPGKPHTSNPLEGSIIALVSMARSGLYEASLNSVDPTNSNTTYDSRFLADTGVLGDQAQALGITTEQYGMIREEKGHIPPGAWWLAPIGVLNHTVLANDDNGDRDGAIILGLSILLIMAFPFIPILNRIPEWLHIDTLIWRVKKR